jgi:glycosyltransferase involved in cell wall biosynthesis
MKIIFANRFFYPDHSATSQLLSDLAFDLARQGREVCVVASRHLYDDPKAVLAKCATVNGVSVRRAWSTRFGRAHLPGRTLDYLSFYFGAAWILARSARHGDVIVAKTDPPLLSVVAAAVAKLRGAALINWLQDIFPEVAAGLLLESPHKQAGLAVRYRLLRGVFKCLQRLRDGSLRKAQYNVVIGELMRERLVALNIAANRIRVIPNWADGQAIKPVGPVDNPLRQEWQIAAKFVAGYSGNLGRAHEIATLLAGIEQLRGDSGIVFLFIGGGAQLQRLQNECARRRLANVLFKPYQPRERLQFSLSAADAHLITLQPQMEGLIVPSKFYGIAAAGRPCVFIGAQNGEIAAILRETECGIIVQPGDAEGFAKAIRRLAADPSLCKTMGDNARTVFEQRFEQRLALQAWSELLEAM